MLAAGTFARLRLCRLSRWRLALRAVSGSTTLPSLPDSSWIDSGVVLVWICSRPARAARSSDPALRPHKIARVDDFGVAPSNDELVSAFLEEEHDDEGLHATRPANWIASDRPMVRPAGIEKAGWCAGALGLLPIPRLPAMTEVRPDPNAG